jgi:hypothetical protein
MTVSRLERGEMVCNRRTLLAWALVTGVPVDVITSGSQCACTTSAPGDAA